MDSKRERTRDAVQYGVNTGIYTGGAFSYTYRDIRNNFNLIYNNPDSMFKSILAYNSRRLDSESLTLKSGKIVPGRSTNYKVYTLTFDNQKTWKLNHDKRLEEIHIVLMYPTPISLHRNLRA